MLDLRADSLTIARSWNDSADWSKVIASSLSRIDERWCEGGVEIVAVGKSALAMRAASARIVEDELRGELSISHTADATVPNHYVGEHPTPGRRSMRAGCVLARHCDRSSDASVLLLVSGGTSSIIAAPVPPITLSDLDLIWHAGLMSGVNVTHLNRVRAALSALHGGAVLRRYGDRKVAALVQVDNVQDGWQWVGSSFLQDYLPDDGDLRRACRKMELPRSTEQRVLASSANRAAWLDRLKTRQDPVPIDLTADPSDVLSICEKVARQLGYSVKSLGPRVQGTVHAASHHWAELINSASRGTCLIGTGEYTVEVRGQGLGGRCQELALRTAVEAGAGRRFSFTCIGTDGQDHLAGVWGATVDHTTAPAQQHGAIKRILGDNSAFHWLLLKNHLVFGGASPWNLCDVYIACVD